MSDLVGYIGAAVLVLAYFLNQTGRLRSEDWRYPGLNLLGSGWVTVSLLFHMNAPSLAIELFWSAISLYGIWKSLRARQRTRPRTS